LIDSGLDAMNVDIKGDAASVKKFCKIVDVEKVWAATKLARSRGVHIELTTLVIPTLSDSDSVLRGVAERIAGDLGRAVPWHVTSYYPAYQFIASPTPVSTLERAWELGKEAGLEFVYTGNVPGDPHENTYCPACGRLLIRRLGFEVVEYRLDAGKCPQCGRAIPGVWGSQHPVDQAG
jgi:pyruvate formate lyase activating enzyme